MAQSHNPIPELAERELVITRVSDAPRELVFKAWTDPERLMRWWAPKGAREGTQQGWTEMLDRLAEDLAKAPG